MNLDVPTLIAMLVLGHLVLVVELWFVRHLTKAEPALRDWTLGVAATLLGLSVMTLRPLLPALPAVWLGSAALLLGFWMYTRAVYRFIGEQVEPRWMAYVFGITLVMLILVIQQPGAVRVAFNSVVSVAMLTPAALLIWRHRERAGPALRIVGWTLGLTALAIAARAVDATVHPQIYDGTVPTHAFNVLLFVVAFLNMLGAGFGFVLACFDRAERRMRELATYDALTGCVNRAGADALLANALARGRRDATPVAYVVLDIDHFKRINDEHGHHSGDEALRQFSHAVRGRLRAADSFSRIGGEEFALLLPATDAAGALRCAEAARIAVESLMLHSVTGVAFTLTVSAGVTVVAPGDHVEPEQVYQDADAALYAAKRGGRNRVQFATGTAGEGASGMSGTSVVTGAAGPATT